MDVEYVVDGDELVLDLADPRGDRKRAWRQLRDLGAPLELEPTAATVKARLPREGVDALESALSMMGATLSPAEGQPALDDVDDEGPAYEDVRPVEPEDVVDLALAEDDPEPLRRAIADLGTLAAEQPGFEHRVERDKRYLRRALERVTPDAEDEDEQAPDPVKQAVSQRLRAVPDEDTWKARDFLLELHELAERYEDERPGVELPETVPGFDGRLRDYQREGVSFLLGAELNAVLADGMGLGKAQPDGTPVLTPSGWRRMGELEVGDEVCTPDGEVARVDGVFPQGAKGVFRVVFSDGATTLCCDEHLWAVYNPTRKKRGKPPRVRSLSDLRGDLQDAAGNNKHFIPMTEPVEFQDRELPLHPYVLGALVGDGSITHGVRFSSADEAVVDRVRELLPEDVEMRKEAGENYDYRLCSDGQWAPNPVKDALKALGLHGKRSEHKFIPDAYLFSSVEDRIELLRGLLDTDGHVRPSDGNIEYSTASRELAEDVVSLVRSLGGTCGYGGIREKPTSHLPSYRVSIILPDQVVPFHLPRKREVWNPREKYPPTRSIVDVRPVGNRPCRCISIDHPDQLYITEEFIVTHNTIQTIAAVLLADTRALVVCPANVLHNWAAEVERFTGEEAAIWHGRDVHGPDEARFRVTTYTSLRYRDWRDTDADTRPVLVLDEAHKVRNPETQRSRLVKDLPQHHRVLLTGTPIVNGLEDYNELLLHVGEDRWPDSASFRDTWMHDRKLLTHPEVRQATADLLQKATRHVVLRRRKDEVLEDLPERTIQITRHALADEQRTGYDRLARTARETMREADSEVEVFAQLHKLRQTLLEHRVPVLVDRIEDLVDAGEHVVVYAHYHDALDALEDAFPDVSARIDGDTPPERREAISRELGEPDGPRVLVAQTEAGGVGLNFTGARWVIFAHLGWTAAVHRQAIDRVHRIGQDRPVNVEFFVTPDTIDERMVDLILEKEADANLALADDDTVLDRGELAKALLEDDDQAP